MITSLKVKLKNTELLTILAKLKSRKKKRRKKGKSLHNMNKNSKGGIIIINIIMIDKETKGMALEAIIMVEEVFREMMAVGALTRIGVVLEEANRNIQEDTRIRIDFKEVLKTRVNTLKMVNLLKMTITQSQK